jgi:hypothetical protein
MSKLKRSESSSEKSYISMFFNGLSSFVNVVGDAFHLPKTKNSDANYAHSSDSDSESFGDLIKCQRPGYTGYYISKDPSLDEVSSLELSSSSEDDDNKKWQNTVKTGTNKNSIYL